MVSFAPTANGPATLESNEALSQPASISPFTKASSKKFTSKVICSPAALLENAASDLSESELNFVSRVDSVAVYKKRLQKKSAEIVVPEAEEEPKQDELEDEHFTSLTKLDTTRRLGSFLVHKERLARNSMSRISASLSAAEATKEVGDLADELAKSSSLESAATNTEKSSPRGETDASTEPEQAHVHFNLHVEQQLVPHDDESRIAVHFDPVVKAIPPVASPCLSTQGSAAEGFEVPATLLGAR